MTPFHIRLPATSANLGPGFDAVALALDLHLEVTAETAAAYSIQAAGRDADVCSRLDRNLMLAVYKDLLRREEKEPGPLALRMVNEIPIGMGCGSSAAARLAGVALASHFGELGWSGRRILEEACLLEGHPDNAAACWLGGFTVAAGQGEALRAVAVDPPPGWTAILVLPDQPLATTAARAVLPEQYSREDAVTNLQNVALLTAAFHAGRADLLKQAMGDHLHQPYRGAVCPLLPRLLPLSGQAGIAGIALSGAGPAVLALVAVPEEARPAISLIREHLAPQDADFSFEILQVALGRRRPAVL